MKKLIASLAALTVLGGCAMLTPYKILFTTPNEAVIDPATDTLDLTVAQPALVYISGVNCDDHEALQILPVVNADEEGANVHNLTLELLADYEAQTLCHVSVTAYDKTTNITNTEEIDLYILEKPEVVVEHAEQIGACTEAGGTWNECGSACDDSDPFCVQVCVPQCEFDEASAETSATVESETVEVNEDAQ